MTAAALQLVQATVPAAMPGRHATDISVCMLFGGRLHRGTVSSKLPNQVCERNAFFPAPRHKYADETMAAVRAIANRCAPWVKIICGQELWAYDLPDEDTSAFRVRKVHGGRPMHEIGGIAWHQGCVFDERPEVILLSIYYSTKGAVSTLHHEVWHVAEHHVHDADFDVVNAAVQAGHAMPGEYLASDVERRARAYQGEANSYDEGWRPTCLFGTPVSRLDRVFLSVHDGSLAADINARRPVAERLFPGEAAVRQVRRLAGAVGRLGRQVQDELGWQGILVAGVAVLTLAHLV